MIVGIPKETLDGENRVAVVPESVVKIRKAGFEVCIESGAGVCAGFPDADYVAKEARAVTSAEAFSSDIVLMVNAPTLEEVGRMKEGAVFIGLLWPHQNAEAIALMTKKKITGFAMDRMPRITRAQSMDVLSSMSSIAGYKCVLEAAMALPKIFPMMMTAAGTIFPAKIFILGAGVAGLQAIATARRLGAVVEAYDVRPQVKEEVQSLGAKFVELPISTEEAVGTGGYAKAQDETFLKRQRELMTDRVRNADVVIATAQVPGKKAPILVTEDMIKNMRPGSVIIDLAAEQGGNCELSEAGVKKIVHGVTLIGMKNPPSTVAFHASQMYSRNVTSYLLHLAKDGKVVLDMEDELTKAPLVTGVAA